MDIQYINIFRRNEETGRLGVRITETPSGIYVESVEDVSPIDGSETDSGVSLEKVLSFAFLSLWYESKRHPPESLQNEIVPLPQRIRDRQ